MMHNIHRDIVIILMLFLCFILFLYTKTHVHEITPKNDNKVMSLYSEVKKELKSTKELILDYNKEIEQMKADIRVQNYFIELQYSNYSDFIKSGKGNLK